MRSLSVKIPLTGFILALFIACVVGTVFYIESQQLLKEQAVEELKIESQIIKPFIENFYRESASDIVFLSNTPPIQEIVNSIEQINDSNLLLWQHRLQTIFSEFLNNKPIYKKISYLVIEDNVHSVVSVENKMGQTIAVPLDLLSKNIKLDSLKDALSQEAGHVYFSEIAYQKATETSKMQSSLFIGMPVYSGNKELFGLVAIEIDFALFIQTLKNYSLEKITFYIANSKGDLIYLPDSLNSQNNNENIVQLFPALNKQFSPATFSENYSQNIAIDEPTKLVYYSTIELTKFNQENLLHLVVEKSSGNYNSALENMRFRAVILALLLAIFSLAFSIFASKRLISALLLMTRSVTQYEEQGNIGELPTKENDEVGILARSFRNLLVQVEQKSADQRNETIRAESALAKLHSIVNSIADAVININGKGEILAFNYAAEKMFGYLESEVLGKNVSLLMPSHYALKHDDYLKSYLHSGSRNILGRSVELTAMRKDGEKFSMHLSVSEVKTAEGTIFTGLIRDVTINKLLEAENKRGIQEAKEMAWRLDFALSAPGIGVWDYNISTGVSKWDRRMYELFGYDGNSTIPPEKIWHNSIHSEDISFVEEQFSQVAKTGIDLHFEYRIVLSDKTIKFVETHAQVLKDDQAHYFRVVGTHRDITEQRNLQVLKQNALDMAEHALLLRSQFLASMSHEIRTPMNGVLGMLGLLEQSELTEQQQHHLQLASSSAQFLLILINDILDFSKIEAGKLELEILDFDIRSQLGDFAESMAVRAQEKGLELILDVSNVKQSMVKGDPSRLRQILSNLVGNSIKFTDEGEVLIKVTVEKHQSRLQLTCTVSDTGIGIPENKISTLFDSFTQVDASTTRKYGGTGLGLAIVKQLSQLMSGDISVTSEEGRGSAFTFTALLDESTESQHLMPSANIKGKQILIVDDNATNLAVLKGQLTLWGAIVTQANNGFVALEKVANSPSGFFDAAILDMQMPGMNGATLGEKLKGHKHTLNTKLIMMTSMGERGDARFFAELGFSAYFPKPATTSDLFDALTVVLDDCKALSSATPLVTHHHIRTLKRRELNHVVDKNSRILLVEDNRINQAVIIGVLGNIGLSADVAGNGVEALAALNTSPDDSPYQLIIMDCQMPELDGYDATKAIRAGKAKEVHRDIPIIAMTANAMKGDKEKCLAAGMNDYATKPVDADILHEKVATWLGGNKESLPCAVIPNPNKAINGKDKNAADKLDTNDLKEKQRVVWDKAGLLKRIRNNDDLAKQLASMFINDMAEVEDKLVAAMEKLLLTDIIALAHKITGSAKNLGGMELANVTQRIEQAAKKNNIAELSSLKSDISMEYKLFIQALQNFITTEDTTEQPIDKEDL